MGGAAAGHATAVPPPTGTAYPAEMLVQLPAPAADVVPGGQVWQDRAFPAENFPPAQREHDEPFTKVPGVGQLAEQTADHPDNPELPLAQVRQLLDPGALV